MVSLVPNTLPHLFLLGLLLPTATFAQNNGASIVAESNPGGGGTTDGWMGVLQNNVPSATEVTQAPNPKP